MVPGPVPAVRDPQDRTRLQEIADTLILRDLYEEVAKKEGVPVPDDDMAPFDVKLDGASFDPAAPEKEAARV